ncbi:MAG: Uma2 family endonuclease [Candidatus Methylumidiphilus sp.]
MGRLERRVAVFHRSSGSLPIWIVDPAAQTLEAFELCAGRWTLIATLKEDDPVAVPPFAAVGFSLGDLWA